MLKVLRNINSLISYNPNKGKLPYIKIVITFSEGAVSSRLLLESG